MMVSAVHCVGVVVVAVDGAAYKIGEAGRHV